MTLDQLVDEYNKHCDNPYSPIDIRAGIRAVVEALRDEMGFDYNECGDCTRNDKLFDEILASDGVEAAGGSARKDEQAMRASPYTPAAAPVCEWTTSPVALGFCSAGCQPHNAFVRPIDNCHLCGKPIKFVEWPR